MDITIIIIIITIIIIIITIIVVIVVVVVVIIILQNHTINNNIAFQAAVALLMTQRYIFLGTFSFISFIYCLFTIVILDTYVGTYSH